VKRAEEKPKKRESALCIYQEVALGERKGRRAIHIMQQCAQEKKKEQNKNNRRAIGSKGVRKKESKG